MVEEEDSEATKLAGVDGGWSAKVSWPMTVAIRAGGIARGERVVSRNSSNVQGVDV